MRSLKIRKLRFSREFKLFIFLTVVGLIISVLFLVNINQDSIKSILENITNQNYFSNIQNNAVVQLKNISLSMLFSVFIIGLIYLFSLIIFESFSIFLNLFLLVKLYGVGGAAYSLIYNLINSGIYIFILYYILKKIISLINRIYFEKKIYKKIDYKESFDEIKKMLIIIIISFLFSVTLYYFSNKILNIFAFLIK